MLRVRKVIGIKHVNDVNGGNSRRANVLGL